MNQPESQKQRPFRQSFSFDEFTLDLSRACLLRAGREVKLRPKSFEALKYLIANSKRLLSKEELMQAVWPDTFVTDDSLVQCLRDIRRALGDEQQRYIKTVARRGYIFDANVVEQSPTAPTAFFTEQVEGVRVIIEESDEQTHPDETARAISSSSFSASSFGRRRPSHKALAFSIPLIGLVVALSYFWISRKQTETKPRVTSIAVLPFKPLAADAGDEYLGLGMADTLITKLSNLRQVIVRPTSAVRKYTAPDQDALAAGQEQRVEAVLEGSIQRAGDKVRVTVRLVDVRNRALLWGYYCDEYCKDIFAAQDLISEKVARALALNLTGEDQRQLAKRYTDNIKAYDLYQKGRYFWEKRTGADLKKALGYFEQGIALDPNYALAHAGIAHCYGPLGYLGFLAPEIATPRMKVAAIKALELDDTLAEAHTALGAFLAFHEWDWEGAEREFKRAVELNPNYPTTYAWHSQHLENMRRLDESLAVRKRAQELDPLNLTINNFLAYNFSLVGQHDRAIEIYHQTLELDPNFFLAHLYLGYVYERIGRHEEAIAEFGHAVKLSGNLSRASGALGHAYAVSGRQDGARKALNELLKLSKQRYISPFDIAIIYTGLGDKDQAFAWFEKAYERRDPSLSNIKIDHRLERFHSDPRFSSLLRRMRLAT